MPWCPNCKNEYRKGITVCADCGAELVETLTEASLEPLLVMEQPETLGQLVSFLESEGLADTTVQETEDGKFELLVPSDRRKEAAKLAQAFLAVEKEKELSALSADELTELANKEKEEKEAARNVHTYVKVEEKYKDTRSTGYMFLVFGVVGLAFTILNSAGVLNILSGWFSLGVAAGLFLVFLLIGIASLRHAASLKGKIGEEADQMQEVTDWLKAHITPEVLSAADDPEASAEANDIFRFDHVKELLREAYPELDDNFTDKLVDEFLNTL